MTRGRIKGAAIVVSLFLSIVGLGAYAIVSLAPAPEYSTPPKGSFLQDASMLAQVDAPQAAPQSLIADITPSAPGPDTLDALVRPAPRSELRARAAKREALPVSAIESPPTPQRSDARPTQRLAALPPAHSGLPQAPALQVPRSLEPRLTNVLTTAEIRRIKLSLRLTPDQEVHWPPVGAVLAEIGTLQVALAKAGQNTADAFSSQTSMRIYWAARPLIGLLRDDQKAQIRVRARMMGLEGVASYL